MKLKSLLMILSLTAASTAVGGSSNIGSTNRASRFLIDWCRGNIGMLEDARSNANLALLDGDFQGASAILSDAFRAAAMNATDQSSHSMVYRALTRTIEMSEALMEPGIPVQVPFTVLNSSIDLIIKEIAPIDTAFYIPYRFERPVQMDPEFERRFEQMARQQIDWFLETFASHEPTTGAAMPRYSPRSYLRLLEFVTAYVAEDLNDSLWNARYACVSEQLGRLNARLAAYNLGNVTAFRNDRRAIISATAELRQIRNKIGPCGALGR